MVGKSLKEVWVKSRDYLVRMDPRFWLMEFPEWLIGLGALTLALWAIASWLFDLIFWQICL